ncbi:DnaB-like helicase C-terminal domain-containing protein [Orientia tsutsugamushi]|uniref:DnaB-like helicase C-terminal domain-containing protein n=1 Tax=Orientia tsutsugamushi TaxID=784 RepID=UPI0035282BEC
MNGISSGLLDLDSKLGGFKNSDLIILAGRPSMGKTALGVNLAVNACKYFLSSSTQQNSKVSNITPSVGFFSLEMSSQQISTRILSIESEINSSALFNGKIGEQDVDKLKTVQDEIQKWNFFIDDAPAISISAIRSRARRLKRTHNNDINDISHVNEEYYHFTAKPEQEAKVEIQQENSIKQCTTKDISTPLFMHIKEQRQYDYDVTILSAEGKTISSFQEAGIDSRMVYSSNVNNLKYYQPFQGEKILIAASNDKQNKEYISIINEAATALKSKGAITSIVVPSEGEDFNEMLKNKGAIAVKELAIPEIMKLINTQNVKIGSEQVVKTDIAPKIRLRR